MSTIRKLRIRGRAVVILAAAVITKVTKGTLESVMIEEIGNANDTVQLRNINDA